MLKTKVEILQRTGNNGGKHLKLLHIMMLVIIHINTTERKHTGIVIGKGVIFYEA
jgi:hypothetical protein